MNSFQVFALCGSLRAASSNRAILEAAARLAPPEMAVEIYPDLGALPHFNPDLESDLPPVVAEFRARVKSAGAVIISTPEYVHGLPGSFKNALDWLVSEGELWDKPVAVISVANRGEWANASLREILKTLMARVSETALPIGSNKVSVEQIVGDAELARLLRAALAHSVGC